MMQPKTTLRDVAALSGFSVTTVSHVLNDVPGKRIPAVTRDRVRAAARDLSYRPNLLAQGLRNQRSNTLGFISDHVAITPHAGRSILGAQDAAAEQGSMILLMNSGSDPDREIRALLDRQVDGIIYAAEYHQVVTLPEALPTSRAVLLDARSLDGGVSSVVPDEAGGAMTAVRELVAHGHRHIGFVSNADDIPARDLRLAGWKASLKAAGLKYRRALVASDFSEAEGGYRAASALLGLSHPPTALFCFNDRMAMGAYQAAADHGLRIPDDLSIVGFDNQEIIAASLRPGLTTVALPHYEMGRWAVKTLLKTIDSGGAEPVQHIEMACPLVRRSSVAPPRTT
jgi:LacI family transcriptional regulator